MSITEDQKDTLLKQALVTIKNLQDRLKDKPLDNKEPIAVIGMACRFPGACNTPDDYWELLKAGKECVIDVPKERWDASEYYDEEPGVWGKMYVRQSNFLQRDISEFDAKFFKILPTEANAMDPQQRQLLEVCWEALENAGENPVELKGSQTGVFIGISSNCEYAMLPQDQSKVNQYTGTGTTSSIAAGRISYVFGWNGPALSLDTACSSSLVSTHLAVESLRRKECDLALSGGVSLMLSPVVFSNLCMMNAVSADGRCKPFDATGSGYGRGEGCGILVLKRLSDAQKDGDTIYAVIKGGAVNNDGASSGLTVPNGKAQKMVIDAAIKDAEIKPSDISYLEAHGTGTPLGDPIEVGAITEVFGKDSTRKEPLIIGAVKGNLGHLESSAGVASLIKVALSLYHKEIPCIVNSKVPNPRINFSKIPAVLPQESMPWAVAEGKKRIAGVSSFGFSGTNAHIIMEEAPKKCELEKRDDFSTQVLCLSAKDEQSLMQLIRSYEVFLKNHSEVSVKDICYVANVCHATYRHRIAFLGRQRIEFLEELKEVIQHIDAKGTIYNKKAKSNDIKAVGEAKDIFESYYNNQVYSSKVDDQVQPKLAFIIGDDVRNIQGSVIKLYNNLTIFKEKFDECITYFEDYYDKKIKDSFLKGDKLSEIANKACLFTAQYALMMSISGLNIKPEIILGERTGQFIAAVIAGIIDIKDAVKHFIVSIEIMKKAKDVVFARIFMSKPEVIELIRNWEGRVFLSAVYSPNEMIISAKEEVMNELMAKGVKLVLENMSGWPSEFYGEYLNDFEHNIGEVNYTKAKCRYIPETTGMAIKNSQRLTVDFWKENMILPVQYDKALMFLYEQGYRLFVQVGNSPCKNQSKDSFFNLPDVMCMTLLNGEDSLFELLQVVAKCNCLGSNINWHNFYKGYTYQKVMLPNYAFAKTKYWLTPLENTEQDMFVKVVDFDKALKAKEIVLPYKQKQYVFTLTQKNLPEVLDNSGVVHIGYYLEMLSNVGKAFYGKEHIDVKSIEFISPLMIFENEIREILLVMDSIDENNMDFEFYSKNEKENDWNLHVQGELSLEEEINVNTFDIEELKKLEGQTQGEEEFYKKLEDKGFNFGPAVRWVNKIWHKENEALIQIRQSTEVESKREYALQFHPGIIDSCSQVFNFILTNEALQDKKYMVASANNFELNLSGFDKMLYAKITITNVDEQKNELEGQISIVDHKGKVIARVSQIRLKEFDEEKLGAMLQMMKESSDSSKGRDKNFLNQYTQSDKENKVILLTQYLRNVMAEIMGIDVEELDVNEPLDDLGLDSMMGVSFHTKVSQLLGAKFSFADLICAGTIAKMAQVLPKFLTGSEEFEEEQVEEVEESVERWIYDYKPKKNVKLRIFCFPYGFGSADMYKEWQERLGPEIDVCPIKLPGFDVQRMSEKTPDSVEEVIDKLEELLSEELYDVPCVAFGHSWGSLFAYRLAYRLSKNSKFKVVKLMVSGFTAPNLPNTSLMKILGGLKLIGLDYIPRYEEIKDDTSLDMVCKAFMGAWNTDSDNQEKTVVAMKVTLPFIMAAYRIVDRFKFNKEEVFEVPIVGFHGIDDEKVTLQDMNEWENITSKSYRLHTLPGDHVFIDKSQSEEQFMSLIKQELNEIL